MFAQETNKNSKAPAGKTPEQVASPADGQSPPETNALWHALAMQPAGGQPTPAGSADSTSVAPRAPYRDGQNGARFHTDDNAALAAKRLDASAFTIGRDVFFGRNQYAPGTPPGDKLIRHELAHVAQAGGELAINPRQSLQVAPPDHPAEREASRIGNGGGSAALRVMAPTVFRVKATPRDVARLDRDHIFGNPAAVPPLPGIKLEKFQDYTEQDQADWFVHPTLLPADRKFLWEMLLLLQEGSHIRLAIGDVMVADLKGVPAGDWPALKAFCRGRGSQHTVRIFPPLPPLADRIALGHTLLDLEVLIPPAVLEVTVGQSQLQRLLAAPALLPILTDYWIKFEPFLEEGFSPAPGAKGLEFDRVLDFVTSLGGPGLAPLIPLQGASAAVRWVRNLHRFPLPMLNQLVTNFGDTSGTHPLVLILHTGHDAPGAFQKSFMLFSNLVKNVGISSGNWWWQPDLTNLVLMIEGQTSITDMAARIPFVAATWGHDDGSGKRQINQVVIAGHGSGHTVSLAGVGPAVVHGGNVHHPEERLDPVNNPGPTTALLDALMAHMDPATARLLYAGCLVGSRTVQPNTPAAAIPAAVAADQSLAQFTETRAAAAKPPIPVTPGVTVQAARGSVGLAALTTLYDPATGLLKPNYPSDPNVFGSSASYATSGLEPEGVLRAAVEVAATSGTVPAELMLRARLAMPVKAGHWYDMTTRMLVPLVLPAPQMPPAGVNIQLVNEAANVAQVPFLVLWPKFGVGAAHFVFRLNPQPFAADVYTGLLATPQYAGAGADEKRLRIVVDQGNFVRTLVAANLLSGILATGLNADQLQKHLNITNNVLGTHEAALMPLLGAPTVEQIRLALAWFALDPANVHVRAFLTAQVAVAPGAPPAFNPAVSAEITAAGQSERDILRALGFKLVAAGAAAVGGGPAPPLANVRVPGSAKNTAFVDAEHPYVATVTAPIANVRPSPSRARNPIGSLKAGAAVNVAGFNGDWAAIDFNGKLGFVHKALITPP